MSSNYAPEYWTKSIRSLYIYARDTEERENERVFSKRLSYSDSWEGGGEDPEGEFLDIMGTKVLRVYLLAIRSHLH